MAANTDSFEIGDRIVLTGLRAASHLNDRHGTVGTLIDASSGRIGVDLDLDPSQSRVNAKPSNIIKEEAIAEERQNTNRAAARGGTLVETHHGRTVSFLLEAMRYLAAVRFLSDPDVEGFHDVDKIRTTQGQRGLLRVNHFNATAWSNWLDDDGEPEFRRKGVFNLLRTYIQEELPNASEQPPIAELPKASEALDCIEAAAGWHIRIHGDFWVVGHDEEGGTGTYLVPSGNKYMVYKVLGVRNALFPMIRQDFGETPILMTVTLIPWYGRLLYDGVVLPKFQAGNIIKASNAHSQNLKAAVQKAVDEGRVVERISELEISGVEDRVAISQRLSPNSPQSNMSPNRQNENQPSLSPPTEEETSLMQRIIAVRSLPQENNMGYWVYRRMGYSEVENPMHMGMVMAGSGMIMGPFRCSALEPTAVDILKDLVEKCRSGNRPWSIGIDDRECCRRLQVLFRDQSILRVQYYKPPSKEEQASACMLGPGWNRTNIGEEGKN